MNTEDCFECGGIGPCDICNNSPSTADDVVRHLHREGCVRRGTATKSAEIILRHLVANMQLVVEAEQNGEDGRELIDQAARQLPEINTQGDREDEQRIN